MRDKSRGIAVHEDLDCSATSFWISQKYFVVDIVIAKDDKFNKE